MNNSAENKPDLEPRFQMPESWRWHSFKTPQGKKIRFGTVAPESHIPDAVVIGLQGLGEFTEKYFEVAHSLLDRNLSFWMIDWQGQGQSDRHLKDPHKRHSNGFQQDVDDLHYFLMEYVKHSAVHPDVGRIPLVMLGHSMGANIGMHYLKQHQDMFACAAFTSPLIGIKAAGSMPGWFARMLTGTMKELLDQGYVGFSQKGWSPDMRDAPKNDIHSSDDIRKKVHNAWCLHDEDLQVGNIDYVWLHEAMLSCLKLQKNGYVSDIQTPCLFALAEGETLVDNKIARKVIGDMPAAEIIEFPDSKHEILMECDSIRDAFFAAFDKLLQVNDIKEKLKPF